MPSAGHRGNAISPSRRIDHVQWSGSPCEHLYRGTTSKRCAVATTPVPTDEQPVDDDARRLAELGYKQELTRSSRSWPAGSPRSARRGTAAARWPSPGAGRWSHCSSWSSGSAWPSWSRPTRPRAGSTGGRRPWVGRCTAGCRVPPQLLLERGQPVQNQVVAGAQRWPGSDHLPDDPDGEEQSVLHDQPIDPVPVRCGQRAPQCLVHVGAEARWKLGGRSRAAGCPEGALTVIRFCR